MLAANLERVLAEVDDDAVVLDIGGWGKPLARADWVLDLMPYETRGLYGRDGDGEERFDERTWIQRDICDREPFPFADDQVDFVVCSHTLEDIRDPIWVCSEINRIGKAGYIEVPSRLEEQTFGVHGPWVGWSHHRWLVDITGDRIEFVFKHHTIHSRRKEHFPAAFRSTLREEERVQWLFWKGGFEYGERILMDGEEAESYFGGLVARHRVVEPPAPPPGNVARVRAKLARLLQP